MPMPIAVCLMGDRTSPKPTFMRLEAGTTPGRRNSASEFDTRLPSDVSSPPLLALSRSLAGSSPSSLFLNCQQQGAR